MTSACEMHRKADGSWREYDAQGIPLARACPVCRTQKLRHYRPDVITDPQYIADEAIDED